MPPGYTFPAPISDLRAWPREGVIFLGWNMPTQNTDESRLEDLLGFKVFRQSRSISSSSCSDCPLDFQVVAEIDVDYPRGARVEGGRVLWEDRSVQPRHEYTYFVLSYNFYKSSSPESNRVKVFWDEAAPAPGEVDIKSENRALEITWKFSAPEKEWAESVGFNLYRRMEGGRFGFFPLNPEPIRETRFVDGGLENGKRYYYEVRAVRNFRGTLIEGPASPVTEGVPEKLTLPLPPTGLVVAFQEGGVALRWNENPEPDIAGYDTYRKEEGETTFRKINPQLIKEPYFLDTTASSKKSYTYRLKAVDTSRKESEFSQEAEISPEPSAPKN
ncbi:MAG: hypothetical protein ABSF48_00960 [Thermodesulfobacteriota bacterium]